ncbi:Holliday junction DNA helicase RuvA [Candidatus Peregrinibacteria bacterium RIFOXYC2_FULL_33_13]|nr:MAG: Holliday junction ATP-dependent DNA helicase RuvA [Candidatus Peregrinibacteria bacterium GW2011_GWA2_33_10]KKP39141.1 MAG: Holliday junction resolvasome DNA-binding subunit, holliday junction DNA helicase RuvA [Candidatus Peregrinibacteria bacterium GW2011_GWC2_33_13]OGJ47217.1 MAG: Holliday junction DNA helicase RuvA [Candidatus Peregrinibacteria bacterium RIFOXYA2_FULL_33_7]OGJ54700.1 MAG: Holliday junction DNA helicase RuvA [Candidatus Peregrinibacteria bacterium RIFOXYC2_FULL_33_13]
MISYLKGNLIYKDQKKITINVNNIGYLVSVPTQTLAQYQISDEIELFIHTHVREDQISLFGFQSIEELEFFKTLTTVSGIGPKVALEILSVPINIVKNAIISEDSKSLSKIPGLGKKIAERMILELKNKIDLITFPEAGLNSNQNLNEDVIQALVNLGYSQFEVKKVLQNIKEDIKDPEEVIRYFLKNV